MEAFSRLIDSFDSNCLLTFLNNYSIIIILSLIILYLCGKALNFTNKVVDTSHMKLIDNKELTSQLRPHYPNGWIPIIESINVRINQIQNVMAFGRHLVAFRGSSGSVHVLDAFCPHMGAHIGIGGKIVTNFGHDCIRCPFHGWTFRGKDGVCVKVPGLPGIEPDIRYQRQLESRPSIDCEPTRARIKVWESTEINGNVFVWYHSEDAKPDWFPETIDEIDNRRWVFEGRTEHHVNCHFQEIPENGPDRTHLEELHSPAVMAGNVMTRSVFHELLSRMVYHDWESKWWPSETGRHRAGMTLTNRNIVFGYNLLEIHFDISQIGPAFVELRYRTSDFGGICGTFIQMVTPLEPNRNRIVHHFYAEPTLRSKLLSKFLLYGELRMLERDLIIWNNKRFVDNPIFSKSEKSLVAFRRWFRQFYSERDLK